MLIYEGYDLLVYLSHKDHLHDLHRGSVGDPDAMAELGLYAESIEHLVDLRPATVDDDRVDADILQ